MKSKKYMVGGFLLTKNKYIIYPGVFLFCYLFNQKTKDTIILYLKKQEIIKILFIYESLICALCLIKSIINK
jgi:hypothetical protein